MEVLEYYDDERVKRESSFFNKRNMWILAIVFMFLFLLFAIISIKFTNPEEDSIWLGTLILSTALAYYFCLFAAQTDSEPRSKLEALKNEYLEQRKAILDKHLYKYSVYKGFKFEGENDIYEEILCDSFQADKRGYVYINISDDDYIFDERWGKEIPYHHITDNTDGHTLTVREIRKFVKEEENKEQSIDAELMKREETGNEDN